MEMINTAIKEKVRAGQPYLYREKGLPSEVYEVRMKEEIDSHAIRAAAEQAMARYPYFRVRYEEHEGDFYAVENELPFEAFESEELIPLGGAQNNYYLIGVTYHGNSIDVSFHHGLADGRGVKSFVESLVYYYCQAAYGSFADDEGILTDIAEMTEGETAEPCGDKYAVDKSKLRRIEGVSRKGFALPETKGEKASHRRYELKFLQKDFISFCKENGASPVVMLSVMMSRAIRELYPDSGDVINSNFPVDARAALGAEGTYKNCVKSISLPYGEAEQEMTTEELCRYYKRLMNEQREPERCKDEFNKIIMLLNVIDHLHSFKKKRMIMKFLDDLKLDTYLISYIGQFTLNENERYVDSIHLFSDCSDGLVMNMTCQCGYFCIDLVQDFKGDRYVRALAEQFERAGIALETSDMIMFRTPCDEIMSDMYYTDAFEAEKDSFMQKTINANVSAYRFVEKKTVGCYRSIENAFIKAFLMRENETVDEAKIRLAEEQIRRDILKKEELIRLSRIA